MHGPPDFAKQPPPPRVMVITRADVQPLPEDWFSPAAHESWAAEPRAGSDADDTAARGSGR